MQVISNKLICYRGVVARKKRYKAPKTYLKFLVQLTTVAVQHSQVQRTKVSVETTRTEQEQIDQLERDSALNIEAN